MAVKLPRSSVLSGLSLTPLIDVVFLLLIFFLVATRFAEEDRELDVPLPTASEAVPMTAKPKVLVVNIDEQGGYFVSGKQLNLTDVEQVLERAAVNNPINQSVKINAHKHVPLESAVAVVNACKKAGIHQYWLAIDGN